MRIGSWTAGALLLASGLAAQEAGETPLEKLLHQKVATVRFDAVAAAHATPGSRGAGLTVVSAEQIRTSGARSLAEALRLIPWLKVPSAGEAAGPRLLILFDSHATGLEISPPEWPELALATQQIASLEAVPGPAPKVRGAPRYAAIIRITTR